MATIITLTLEQILGLANERDKLGAMEEAKAPGMMIAQVFGDHMKVGVIDHERACALQKAFGSEHEGKTVRTAYDVPANDRVEGRDAASSRRVPSHDGLAGTTTEDAK